MWSLHRINLSPAPSGPISNIQRNAEAAALSLSCNLDLQVNHSRMLWRHAIKPLVLITQQLMVSAAQTLHPASSHTQDGVLFKCRSFKKWSKVSKCNDSESNGWSSQTVPSSLSQDDKDEFQSEALNVSARFQNIRNEVASQYGYDLVRSRPGGRGNSTQELFTAKTRMQCDSEWQLKRFTLWGFSSSQIQHYLTL